MKKDIEVEVILRFQIIFPSRLMVENKTSLFIFLLEAQDTKDMTNHGSFKRKKKQERETIEDPQIRYEYRYLGQ